MRNDKLSSTELSLIISEQIRKRRKQLGFTCNDIAERMHVGVTTVQAYELGRNNISAIRLYALSQVLDVPIEYFFNTEEKDIK